MLLGLQSTAAGAYPKSQRSPAGTPSRFWKLLYGWFSSIAGCVPSCLFICRPLVAGDIPINDPGCSPLLNRQRETPSGVGCPGGANHYTQLAYSVLQRGPWHLQQGRSTTRARQTPPVRRNASRIWARSFSSRLGRSVPFPLEGACSGISADADSERSCAGFAV